jgi:hypothetical protein
MEQSIMVNTFATSWFLTLFSQKGQLEFVQQLWDCFFNEGFSIIFRVAIAFLAEARGMPMLIYIYIFYCRCCCCRHFRGFLLLFV